MPHDSILDGRIVTKGWKLSDRAMGEYERTAETFDAWMRGAVSEDGLHREA
ncbi:riboflavin biosynthesis protein RibD domain-containing protein [Corallococcus macrosporus]|uniref:Riboflavin biosynthesis protein RibD domain-containing protein n=1 Tax=Myxococcus fulvus (strain ATCC BAA-855 / HW-1) TaxID=483219 RepID=F8CQU1_MYXFH|nr:hypothetical protein [Corallococcus macrosporus]AEI68005.1 riboflavin biosynthesis protein RibD domain-containing protein [Corallococcus macrosporus]